MEMLAKNNATSVICHSGQLLNSSWWFLVKWKSYSTSNRAAEAAIHVIHRQLCLWNIFLWYWKINKTLNVELCSLHCYRSTVVNIMNNTKVWQKHRNYSWKYKLWKTFTMFQPPTYWNNAYRLRNFSFICAFVSKANMAWLWSLIQMIAYNKISITLNIACM